MEQTVIRNRKGLFPPLLTEVRFYLLKAPHFTSVSWSWWEHDGNESTVYLQQKGKTPGTFCQEVQTEETTLQPHLVLHTCTEVRLKWAQQAAPGNTVRRATVTQVAQAPKLTGWKGRGGNSGLTPKTWTFINCKALLADFYTFLSLKTAP